jgi:hypothetical protein
VSLLPALLAALGYGLLETAFVAERNLLLPWEPRYASLVVLFFLIHAVVAVGAWLAAKALAGVRALGRAFPLFAPAALLVAIHAVTVYRERSGVLPRDLAGTAVTLGILLACFAAAVLLARAFRDRPRAGAVTATWISASLIAWGAGAIAAARPPDTVRRVPPRAETDTLQAADTGQRVFVFGFDGATWDVLDPMIAAGRLPNLAALAARGRTFDLETFQPTFSPVIWTSVATGQDRFHHGIHDVVQVALPGGVRLPRSILRTAFLTKTTGVLFRALAARKMLTLIPYRSTDIRSASVFRAASEAGLSASLVEWYVTWPAPALSGVTVSDRFHLQGPDAPDLTRVVAPEAIAEPLRGHVVAPGDVPVSDVLALANLDGLTQPERDAWADRHARLVDELRRNLARDRTTRNVGVDLLARDRDWRLFGLYFRAVDLSHHLTWKYHRAARGGPEQSGGDAAALADVVSRYHELMDGIVGEILDRLPDDANIVLLSDHGFEDTWDHVRGPEGVAILAGPAFAASPERGRLSVYDVAPTVAALLGIPPARDLAREARLDLLAPGVDPPRPAPVPTWSRAGGGAAGSEEVGDVDRAEVDRLRALGYVQ